MTVGKSSVRIWNKHMRSEREVGKDSGEGRTPENRRENRRN